jgi:hypothetical protein
MTEAYLLSSEMMKCFQVVLRWLEDVDQPYACGCSLMMWLFGLFDGSEFWSQISLIDLDPLFMM